MNNPLVNSGVHPNGESAIFIKVRNVKKSKAWYASAMGLLLDEHNRVQAFGINFVLYESQDLIPTAEPIITFETEDLVFAYRSLSHNGVELLDEPNTESDFFRFKDLDGNIMIMRSYK